ncbi:hypothetical protein Tco_0248281 [Tanacetum coccineum]
MRKNLLHFTNSAGFAPKKDNIEKSSSEIKYEESVSAVISVSLVYENSKQKKRVMDIKEIPKFCDVTLKRVLEKVKKFNLNVKHGYADPDIRNEDAKYMRFYEEYIIDRLRHQDQMRR